MCVKRQSVNRQHLHYFFMHASLYLSSWIYFMNSFIFIFFHFPFYFVIHPPLSERSEIWQTFPPHHPSPRSFYSPQNAFQPLLSMPGSDIGQPVTTFWGYPFPRPRMSVWPLKVAQTSMVKFFKRPVIWHIWFFIFPLLYCFVLSCVNGHQMDLKSKPVFPSLSDLLG